MCWYRTRTLLETHICAFLRVQDPHIQPATLQASTPWHSHQHTACASDGIAGKGIAVTQHDSSAEHGPQDLAAEFTGSWAIDRLSRNRPGCGNNPLDGSHAMAPCSASSAKQPCSWGVQHACECCMLHKILQMPWHGAKRETKEGTTLALAFSAAGKPLAMLGQPALCI